MTFVQEMELQLVEREAEQATLAKVQEQLREAKHKITELMHVYQRMNADKDDVQRRMRSSAMELSRHKLVVAHLQRQLDRVRKENLRLRCGIQDLSAGRQMQVIHPTRNSSC
jgi:chromosome segregation ATPase